MKQAVGAAEAGKRFIAITDPGSKMQKVAEGGRFPAHISSVFRASAGAIRRSRISAWFRRDSGSGPT